MGIKTEKEYEVHYYEVNYKLECKISSIINYFCDIGTFQSESLGVGIDYLTERRLAWVFYRYDINIKRYPKFGEKIKVVTKAKSFKKFYASREYEIYDENNEKIVDGEGTFLLINIDKRRAVRIPDDQYTAYGVELDEKSDIKIEKLEKLGVTCFGENRVQAFLEKYENYHGNGEFQFIGTLQPNKVKYIIDKVTLIHAVDRYSLLKEIEKQAAKRDLEMPVLIQVNIAKEESKHGFEVEEIDEVFNSLKDYPHVKVRGLMMMAPHIESSETEKYFKMTQELLQRLQKDYPMYQLDQLSMGMSNDYHEALNHGSTMIRIGSALFK